MSQSLWQHATLLPSITISLKLPFPSSPEGDCNFRQQILFTGRVAGIISHVPYCHHLPAIIRWPWPPATPGCFCLTQKVDWLKCWCIRPGRAVLSTPLVSPSTKLQLLLECVEGLPGKLPRPAVSGLSLVTFESPRKYPDAISVISLSVIP